MHLALPLGCLLHHDRAKVCAQLHGSLFCLRFGLVLVVNGTLEIILWRTPEGNAHWIFSKIFSFLFWISIPICDWYCSWFDSPSNDSLVQKSVPSRTFYFFYIHHLLNLHSACLVVTVTSLFSALTISFELFLLLSRVVCFVCSSLNCY